ncbi:MAG: CxxxxCH/CxxCH domain-containing protein [Nitrospiraceae bacterium]|nr:CxxxxCH/CxxCH domain-containing protein [Nitrospiraceae bacterium]
MKRSTKFMISGLIALIGMLIAAQGAYAVLDPPHNGYDTRFYTVACSRCHYDTTTSSTPSWMTAPTDTDHTLLNNLCTDCHSVSKLSGVKYDDINTHSSGNTSNTYGDWSIECRVCHNPHAQVQTTGATANADPTDNVVSGLVSAVASSVGFTTSAITVSGVSLTLDYTNYALIPNTLYPTRIYRIASNTTGQITVYGLINRNYAGAGKTFAIRYGKLVNDTITTPNYGGVFPVKFYAPVGPNSFGTSTNPANVTGVCQVCHTQTQSFNRTGTVGAIQEGVGHPGNVAGVQNCTECHTHKSGFKGGGCTSCHGNPPVDQTTLVYGSANGNNPALQTGSQTAGAHQTHVSSLAYGCTTCHTGGMPVSAIDTSKQLQMGFSGGGMYYGRPTLSNGYTYQAGNVTTVISTTGPAMSCTTVYCHSNVQNPATGSGGPSSYGNPQWSGAVVCGDCHKAGTAMDTGSHAQHVGTAGYSMPCSNCHLNAGDGTPIHVNNVINVNFDAAVAGSGAYNGSNSSPNNHAPGQGYGNCSSVYCHGNFTGGAAATPTWGNAATGDCGTCHGASSATPPTGGSHGLHAGGNYAFGCQLCHYSVITTGTTIANKTLHADHSTNWQFSTADPRTNGAQYNGATSGANASVGTNYGGCTNLYCHSQGQSTTASADAPNSPPTWGVALPSDCTGCHDADKNAASKMHTGSHTAHVSSSNHTCNLCHSTTVATASMSISTAANHANRKVNIAFTSLNTGGLVGGLTSTAKDPGTAPVSCTNLYCHGGGSPTWSTGNGSLSCGSCHKASSTLAGKHSIHYGVTTTATNAEKTAANNSTTTAYVFTCGVCHDSTQTTHAGGAVSTWQAAEVKFDATVAGGGNPYTGRTVTAGVDSNFNWTGGQPGTCGTTYCHSAGTASSAPYSPPFYTSFTWTGPTFDCGSCHGGAPGASSVIASNVHGGHINDTANRVGRNVSCTECHNATASSTTVVGTKSNHVNHLVNIKFNNAGGINLDSDAPAYNGQATTVATGATKTPGTAGYNCSNVYCHSIGNLSGTGGTIIAAGGASFRTPTWTAVGALDCDNCHGNQAGKAYPTYASGAPGSGTENSHVTHVEGSGYTCNFCHVATTISTTITAGTMTLIPGGRHLNRTEDVVFATYQSKSGVYNPGAKTCSATYCHGGGTPTWGANGTVTCGSCHLNTTGGDVNDYTYNNGSLALISQAEWTTSGHGRSAASGSYTQTLNGPANFPTMAGTGDPCQYCHTTGVTHGNATNIFRLRSFTSGSVLGMNQVCLNCHETGATGVNPFSGTSQTVNGVSKVDKWHYGTQHSAALNGGQFCWDCHEPHGDMGIGALGPIAMIQSRPVMSSDATTGKPMTIVSTTVTFTSRSAGSSYGTATAPYDRICNVCHTYNPTNPSKMVHYTTTTSDNHNSGTVCTSCHKHSGNTTNDGDAFKGGACNGCHGYPPMAGDGNAYMMVNGVSVTVFEGKGGWSAATGSGGHKAHIDHLISLTGLTLNPSTDSFTGPNVAVLCGTCHDMTVGNHSTDGNGTRNINFNSGLTYSFGTAVQKYNGIPGVSSTVAPKTCSNVSCHYKESPRWQDPAITN